MPPGTEIVMFTQANMNAIDGSSVWTQSIALAFAAVPKVTVTLLLSHAITTDRMLGSLIRNPNITVIDPVDDQIAADGPLSLDAAASTLSRMSTNRPQAFVVRGVESAYRLASRRALRGKLWPYLTDVPQRVEDIDDEARQRIATIMSASPLLLCQTEELRVFLETHFPSVAGKGRVFPPMIPDDIEPITLPPPTIEDLRLCYSGKFARIWNTYEMCELPAQLAERGIRARLTMVGDKVNKDSAWPGFVVEMKKRLESSPGVDWVGGVSHDRSIELMSSAHLGLSWRSPELDDSLELSTKLLEYCAAATPPILNRTLMHESIFGAGYPLFVDPNTPILDLLESVTRDRRIYEKALEMVSDLPGNYRLEAASGRLAEIIDTVLVSRSLGSRMRRSRSRVARSPRPPGDD
jgi:hypothetical protein